MRIFALFIVFSTFITTTSMAQQDSALGLTNERSANQLCRQLVINSDAYHDELGIVQLSGPPLVGTWSAYYPWTVEHSVITITFPHRTVTLNKDNTDNEQLIDDIYIINNSEYGSEAFGAIGSNGDLLLLTQPNGLSCYYSYYRIYPVEK